MRYLVRRRDTGEQLVVEAESRPEAATLARRLWAEAGRPVLDYGRDALAVRLAHHPWKRRRPKDGDRGAG